MTPAGEQLCYVDAYARTAEAKVVAVETGEATLLVLDRTVLYPGGGGQPSDRGLVIRALDGRSWTVRAARKVDGEIVHELERGEADPPATGDLVRVDLDWARRLALMRTHTALHALCGVVWRDHGALVTGGNMEPGSGRMDFEFEDRFRDLMKLKPSEYWRRQCKATFQFDRIGPKLIEEMGVETLMWGSDYPHPDGVWPESAKYIEEQFAGLPADTIHKITCENAAKFYRLVN